MILDAPVSVREGGRRFPGTCFNPWSLVCLLSLTPNTQRPTPNAYYVGEGSPLPPLTLAELENLSVGRDSVPATAFTYKSKSWHGRPARGIGF